MSDESSSIHYYSDPNDWYLIDCFPFAKGMYLSVHRSRNDIKYAVKIIDLNTIDVNLRQYVENEGVILQSLRNSEYIIHLHEYYLFKGKMYLFFEYYKLGDVASFVKSDGYSIRNETTTFKIFRQMVLAVEESHFHNVIHRDIKPDNFLIKSIVDSYPQIVLTDFGLSVVQSPDDDLLSDWPGSAFYAPVELLTGKRYDGRRYDIYSLGICLYFLYYTHEPFYSDDLDELYELVKCTSPIYKYNIPNDLKSLIEKCLSKNPDDRPSVYCILSSDWFQRMLDIK